MGARRLGDDSPGVALHIGIAHLRGSLGGLVDELAARLELAGSGQHGSGLGQVLRATRLSEFPGLGRGSLGKERGFPLIGCHEPLGEFLQDKLAGVAALLDEPFECGRRVRLGQHAGGRETHISVEAVAVLGRPFQRELRVDHGHQTDVSPGITIRPILTVFLPEPHQGSFGERLLLLKRNTRPRFPRGG